MKIPTFTTPWRRETSQTTEEKNHSTTLGLSRVRLTVGNRPVYRGNRPYRPGAVTVPAGYQPLGLENFEFEFQKIENCGKNP
jgi:hypothetical protein